MGLLTFCFFFFKIYQVSSTSFSEITRNFPPGCCAATTDLWTDKFNQTSYIAFTLHYITSDWDLKQRVLFALSFDEPSESGENILRTLKREAARFGIDEVRFGKLIFVTDQGKNLKKALRSHVRFNCFAHLINLVLKKSFNVKKHPENETINLLISNCKRLVKYLKKSPKASRRLNLKTSLKQSVSTRFNSHYLMVRSILNNYSTLNNEFKIEQPTAFGLQQTNTVDSDDDNQTEHDDFDNDNLALDLMLEDGEGSNEDEEDDDDAGAFNNKFYINRSLLCEINSFLEQMDKVIKSLEFDKKPTFHRILLWTEHIKDDILSPSENESEEITTLKAICRTHFDEQLENRREYDVACMLDPNFRTVSFLADARRASAQKNMIEFMKNANATINDVTRNDTVDPTTINWSKYRSEKPEQSESTEVQLYMNIASSENEGDLLMWWKTNEKIYPSLSKLARQLLAIPATNTASERAFSTAGHILGKHRASVKPETVNKLLFLHSNLDLN